MSSLSQKAVPPLQFKSIFDAALTEYKKMTGNDLLDNWLTKELQSCDSVEAVVDIIQQQADAFDNFRGCDDRLMKWIGSTVHVVYTISATLGEGVGMVRSNSWRPICIVTMLPRALPSAKAVFSGIGFLLAVCSSVFLFVHPFNTDILEAAKEVRTSHEALVDLFERIQFFLKRLGVHTRISLTNEMVEILVKIVAEVLSILSIATKEIQQSRTSGYFHEIFQLRLNLSRI